MGNVLLPGATYYARTSALAAGIPETIPIQTINRFCSSGLMALNTISTQIRAGQIEVGLAVGFESMSTTYVLLVTFDATLPRLPTLLGQAGLGSS